MTFADTNTHFSKVNSMLHFELKSTSCLQHFFFITAFIVLYNDFTRVSWTIKTIIIFYYISASTSY